MENNDKTFQLFMKQLGWKWVLIKFEAMILSWIRGGVPNLSWRGVATSSGGTQVAYIGVFSIFEWEIERPIQVAPVERWKLYHLLWWEQVYKNQKSLLDSTWSQVQCRLTGLPEYLFYLFLTSWKSTSDHLNLTVSKNESFFQTVLNFMWRIITGNELELQLQQHASFQQFQVEEYMFFKPYSSMAGEERGWENSHCFFVLLWGFFGCTNLRFLEMHLKCRKIFLGTKEQSLIHWRCSSNYFRGQSKKGIL